MGLDISQWKNHINRSRIQLSNYGNVFTVENSIFTTRLTLKYYILILWLPSYIKFYWWLCTSMVFGNMIIIFHMNNFGYYGDFLAKKNETKFFILKNFLSLNSLSWLWQFFKTNNTDFGKVFLSLRKRQGRDKNSKNFFFI